MGTAPYNGLVEERGDCRTTTCRHCAPVSDVTGVAIPRIDAQSPRFSNSPEERGDCHTSGADWFAINTNYFTTMNENVL